MADRVEATWIHRWPERRGLCPSLKVSAIYRRPAPHRISGPIRHPEWVLDYSLRADQRVRVASVDAPWFERHAGIAHLYAPGTPYWEDSSGVVGDLVSLFIIFTGGEEAGLERFFLSGRSWARFDDPSGLLAVPLRRAAEAGVRLGDGGFWQAQAACCELFDRLQDSSRQGDGSWLIGEGRVETSLAEAVRAYFSQHLAEKITLADLARHLHMSASSVSHRFRQETGMSPMAVLKNQRIALAVSQLVRGATLTAIASQTGFCDAFHLSKAFKQAMGSSPQIYLAALRSQTPPGS